MGQFVVTLKKVADAIMDYNITAIKEGFRRVEAAITRSRPAFAGMHFDDPGTATTVSASSTYYKASNTSDVHLAYLFKGSANNRVEYTGSHLVDAHFTASLSFTCASNNQVLNFAFAVNGEVDVASVVSNKITTGTDIQSVTLNGHARLKKGDYIEVWLSNDTSAANVTIAHGHIICIGYSVEGI